MSKNKVIVTAEPGKQELFVTREFDAPRELVFKAFTNQELLEKWLFHRDLKSKYTKFNPESGSSWRFVQSDTNGNEYAFHGVIHEIAKPERIIQTFEFEGLPEKGHVMLETMKFEELPNDRTKIVSQSVFQSVEDRDGMIESGMEEGIQGNYENLDKLLQKLESE